MHKGRPGAYGHQRGKGNDNNAAGLGLALPGVLDETQRKRKIKTPRTWPPQRWSNHAMQVLWLRSWQQQARNHHLDMQNANTSGLGSCWCTDAYWSILMHTDAYWCTEAPGENMPTWVDGPSPCVRTKVAKAFTPASSLGLCSRAADCVGIPRSDLPCMNMKLYKLCRLRNAWALYMLYVYMNIFRFELHMYMYYQMCTYI